MAKFSRDRFERHIAALGLSYFAPSEFLVLGASHSTVGHRGYGKNTPPPENLWANIDATAKIIDIARHKLGHPVTIINAYRSPAYNRAVRGARLSQHMQFRAVDLKPTGASPQALFDVLVHLREAGAFKGGLGLYRTFVHLDTRGYNATWTG